MPFACFQAPPPQPDSGADGGEAGGDAGNCGPFGCGDAPPVDPCGDADIALRARTQLNVSCYGGSESGCHSDFGGQTALEVDRDGAPWGYDLAACQTQPGCTANCPQGCGIISVPANEMPDAMLVVPFHPESSYLYWKITGDARRALGTGIMPLASNLDWDSGSVDCVADPKPFCSCVVATLGAWIEAGAP
jgi:hypothetical protein